MAAAIPLKVLVEVIAIAVPTLLCAKLPERTKPTRFVSPTKTPDKVPPESDAVALPS